MLWCRNVDSKKLQQIMNFWSACFCRNQTIDIPSSRTTTCTRLSNKICNRSTLLFATSTLTSRKRRRCHQQGLQHSQRQSGQKSSDKQHRQVKHSGHNVGRSPDREVDLQIPLPHATAAMRRATIKRTASTTDHSATSASAQAIWRSLVDRKRSKKDNKKEKHPVEKASSMVDIAIWRSFRSVILITVPCSRCLPFHSSTEALLRPW